MSTPLATEPHACLSLRLQNARLVDERVSSIAAPPSKEPTQRSVKTETNSSFTVGLDDVAAPKSIIIELDYRANLTRPEENKPLASYESKFVALFGIVEKIGFDAWEAAPANIFDPYFSVVMHLAINRAEGTFAAMGLRGITLPRLSSYTLNPTKEEAGQPT